MWGIDLSSNCIKAKKLYHDVTSLKGYINLHVNTLDTPL